MAVSLGELAVRYGCELRGDPDLCISAVGRLDSDEPVLGFVASAAYRQALRETRIAAVILDARLAGDAPVPALVCANPHATYARIASQLHPWPAAEPGIHATAQVHPGAQVHPTAHVAAFALIEDGVSVGARCFVGPYSQLGTGAQLAADVRLVARVTVCSGVVLGERCVVHPGAVLGSDGFGYARDGAAWVKVPQVGTVRVGQDVEIGANTTIDRGALGDTLIADGVKLDNQIQIAHNVVIGAHTAVAACVGIAGSTRIGERCMIGGGTGITGHISIGDDIIITGFGMITRSLDKPGMYSSVIPVEEVRHGRRLVGRLKRIDSMAARLAALEAAAGIAAAPQQEDSND